MRTAAHCASQCTADSHSAALRQGQRSTAAFLGPVHERRGALHQAAGCGAADACSSQQKREHPKACLQQSELRIQSRGYTTSLHPSVRLLLLTADAAGILSHPYAGGSAAGHRCLCAFRKRDGSAEVGHITPAAGQVEARVRVGRAAFPEVHSRQRGAGRLSLSNTVDINVRMQHDAISEQAVFRCVLPMVCRLLTLTLQLTPSTWHLTSAQSTSREHSCI
jgi:cell division inhibitor SulA